MGLERTDVYSPNRKLPVPGGAVLLSCVDWGRVEQFACRHGLLSGLIPQICSKVATHPDLEADNGLCGHQVRGHKQVPLYLTCLRHSSDSGEGSRMTFQCSRLPLSRRGQREGSFCLLS